MVQGPSDTILVAIWITLRIWESKVRNPDPPDWRRFVLSECILVCVCVSSRGRPDMLKLKINFLEGSRDGLMDVGECHKLFKQVWLIVNFFVFLINSTSEVIFYVTCRDMLRTAIPGFQCFTLLQCLQC